MSQSIHSQPIVVNLPAGTHWICACGQFKNYPYCDGGHKGNSFTPIEFAIDFATTVEITP